MAPRSKKTMKSDGPPAETNYFCESCRDYHPTYAALLRHNTAVHKPLRNRRPPKIFFNFSKKNKNTKSDSESQNVPNPGDDNTEPAPSQMNKSKFKCSECPKNFTTESRLLSHKTVHEELLKCYQCNEDIQRSKYYSHLSAHNASALAATLETQAAPTEVYKFPTRRYVYLDSADSRSGGEDELFWCKTCEPIYTFFTYDQLENHNKLESHLDFL